MIIDRIEQYVQYPFGPAWQRAFTFLQTLSPDSPEMRYTIEGDDIFAIVMSYDTTRPETGVFESHEAYVDIQTVLVGSEGFECAFRDNLTVETPYDAAKDAAFYQRNEAAKTRVDVTPGTFVMLYPHDAHLAGLIVGTEPQYIKKVVVKVRRTLLHAAQ